jgi:hypothetical protein
MLQNEGVGDGCRAGIYTPARGSHRYGRFAAMSGWSIKR